MAHLTSSRTGTLYFAYGSNLSPTQMALRCNNDASSSVPVAIARLDGWKWIICERGYANIVQLPAKSEGGVHAQPSNHCVWGVLYNMHALDEAVLDGYEGHNRGRNPDPEPNPYPITRDRIPFLQGGWDYNKHYLPLTVTRWLQPLTTTLNLPPPDTSTAADEDAEVAVTVLAYVDELRTGTGEIAYGYTGRMNRGIRESVALGLPEEWVERVMRKEGWVEKGVEVDDQWYVGTSRGYVPGEEVALVEDVVVGDETGIGGAKLEADDGGTSTEEKRENAWAEVDGADAGVWE